MGLSSQRWHSRPGAATPGTAWGTVWLQRRAGAAGHRDHLPCPHHLKSITLGWQQHQTNLVQLESAPARGWPALPFLPRSAQCPARVGDKRQIRVPLCLCQVPCPLPSPAATSCHRCCRSQLLCGSLQCCQNTRDTHPITAHRALILSENEQLSAPTEKLMPLKSPCPSRRMEIPYTFLFPLLHLSRTLGGTPSTGVWESQFPPRWVPSTGAAPSFAWDPGALCAESGGNWGWGAAPGSRVRESRRLRCCRHVATAHPATSTSRPSPHAPQPHRDQALLRGIPGDSSDGRGRGPCRAPQPRDPTEQSGGNGLRAPAVSKLPQTQLKSAPTGGNLAAERRKGLIESSIFFQILIGKRMY